MSIEASGVLAMLVILIPFLGGMGLGIAIGVSLPTNNKEN